MIGLKDYEHMDGFGLSTWEEVAQLNKALSAGYDIPATSGGVSGSALRVESLESSLKVITFQMQHIKFWQKIPKLPAYSTVEEYNQLTSYGSDAGAFTPEGELGEYDDAAYARKIALVKYLQTVRKVTHPLTLVRAAHGDVVGNEIRNGIMWMLGKIENALYWGNRSLGYAAAEGQEFDGINKLIGGDAGAALPDQAGYSGSVLASVDAKGDPLTEDIIETAANTVVENYGFPTDIFIGTRPLADLAKVMFPKERIVVPYKEGQIGVPINTFASQAGILAFNPDVFLRKKAHPTAASSAKAPLAPTVATAVRSAAGAYTGDFTKTNNGWGQYYYRVSAANRYGESAASAVAQSDAVIADTDYIIVTLNNNAGEAAAGYHIDYLNIYRGVANGGATDTLYLVGQIVAANRNNSGATIWNDINSICSNVHKIFIGELTPQVIAFKQLAPMMKMDLAVVEPSIRWLQLLYGVPVIYAPRKWVVIKNVGEATV
jgi:hypothetical protein